MAAKKTSKRKMGRPRKVFDLNQVKKLAKLGCTQEEIADLLGCSRETVNKRIAKDADFSQAYKTGISELKKSLRKAQLDSAIKDRNSRMLVWMGKQVLGQRDTPVAIELDKVSFMIREKMDDGGTAYFAEGEDLFDQPGATSTQEPE